MELANASLRTWRSFTTDNKVFITGDVDGHHHVARFSWAVVGEDGSRLRAGIDFAEFGPEGDLTRIVGFFDA